jgi:hypothetical protein
MALSSRTPGSQRLLVAVGVLSIGLGACTDAADTVATTSTGELPSVQGPFVESDPDDVLATVEWVGPTGETPALDRPLSESDPAAVLVETTDPDSIRIAVNGSGCPPTVYLTVVHGPPDVILGVTVSEGVPTDGAECADLLTAYAFDVSFSDPDQVDGVEITATN